MSEFVKQAKNLPGFCRAVVYHDNWQFRISQTEARYFSLLECVLEHEDAASLDSLAPEFQRVVAVRRTPFNGSNRWHTERGTHRRRLISNGF